MRRLLFASPSSASILVASWALSTQAPAIASDQALSTKARILQTALDLFNAEGVGDLSAVDIASALGISPGHLYYHFKGKPEIVASLAAAHQEEVDLVLEAALDGCKGAGATLETLWTHVHILVEEAWDCRFLYREAGALVISRPDLAARLRHITVQERRALQKMLTALNDAGAISASPEVIDGMSRLMTTGIGFHAIELELEDDPGPDRERVTRAAAQIMMLPAALAG